MGQIIIPGQPEESKPPQERLFSSELAAQEFKRMLHQESVWNKQIKIAELHRTMPRERK